MTLPTLPPGMSGREYMRIGGGYGALAEGDSPAGGLDVDHAGHLAMSGDLTVDGAVAAGSYGDVTFTGTLSAGLGGIDKTWAQTFRADELWPDATTGPTGPTLIEYSSNRYVGQSHSYPSGGSARAYGLLFLPDDYDGSTLKVTLYWVSTAAGATGDVRWVVGILFGDQGDDIVGFSGSNSFFIQNSTPSGIDELQLTTISLSVTQDKPTLWLSILRDGVNPADTFTGAADLLGVKIGYA